MYKLDVQKFKSLDSCRGQFFDGVDGYCAQGKLIAASNIESITDKTLFGQKCRNILWNNSHAAAPVKLIQAATINNKGDFAEADVLALEWAVESGKFELVNLTPDPIKEEVEVYV